MPVIGRKLSALCAGSSLLPLSVPNPSFFALLCAPGARTCKWFSLASWHRVIFIGRRSWKDTARGRGFSSPFQRICLFLLPVVITVLVVLPTLRGGFSASFSNTPKSGFLVSFASGSGGFLKGLTECWGSASRRVFLVFQGMASSLAPHQAVSCGPVLISGSRANSSAIQGPQPHPP